MFEGGTKLYPLSTRDLVHSPIHLGPANHKHCPLKDHKGGGKPLPPTKCQAKQYKRWVGEMVTPNPKIPVPLTLPL